jgi:hypothetical protein
MAENSIAQTDLRQRIVALIDFHFGAQSAVGEFISTVGVDHIPAVIFGGALRDLLVFSALPRDIDIVVRSRDLSPITSRFSKNIIRHTRFGGVRLGFGDWTFDVWPLHDTWAFRQKLVGPANFSNLPRTTFLDVEGIAAELNPRAGRTRHLYEHRFLKAVSSRSIDINLEENPFPRLCVVRSLITAARLDYAISPRLQRYLLFHASEISSDEIRKLQIEHYGELKCDPDEMISWLRFIETRSTTDSGVKLPVSIAKSLSLRSSWQSSTGGHIQ